MALIFVIVAPPGAGKSQLALRVSGSRTAVFVPSLQQKNPHLAKLPWFHDFEVAGVEQPVRIFMKHPIFRVLVDAQNPVLEPFMEPGWAGTTFIFDDVPQMVNNAKTLKLFTKFLAGIRHRDGEVILTTQRLIEGFPPFARSIADRVSIIGPITNLDDVDYLYRIGGHALYSDKKAFILALKNNPKFVVLDIVGGGQPPKALVQSSRKA